MQIILSRFHIDQNIYYLQLKCHEPHLFEKMRAESSVEQWQVPPLLCATIGQLLWEPMACRCACHVLSISAQQLCTYCSIFYYKMHFHKCNLFIAKVLNVFVYAKELFIKHLRYIVCVFINYFIVITY